MTLRACHESAPGFGLRVDLVGTPKAPSFTLSKQTESGNLAAALAPAQLRGRLNQGDTLACSPEGLRFASRVVVSKRTLESHLDALLAYVDELRQAPMHEVLKTRIQTCERASERVELFEAGFRTLEPAHVLELARLAKEDPAPQVRVVAELHGLHGRARLRAVRRVGLRSDAPPELKVRAAALVMDVEALSEDSGLLPKAVSVLRRFLRDPNPEVRRVAIHQLRMASRLGPSLFPFLKLLVEDRAVRSLAIEMIGALSIEESEGWLIEALNRIHPRRHPIRARSIVAALGAYGTRKSIPALEAFLQRLEVGSEHSEPTVEAIRRLQRIPTSGEQGGLSIAAEGTLSEARSCIR